MLRFHIIMLVIAKINFGLFPSTENLIRFEKYWVYALWSNSRTLQRTLFGWLWTNLKSFNQLIHLVLSNSKKELFLRYDLLIECLAFWLPLAMNNLFKGIYWIVKHELQKVTNLPLSFVKLSIPAHIVCGNSIIRRSSYNSF